MDVPLARFLTRFSFEDESVVEPVVEEPEATASTTAEDPIETLIASALANATAHHAEEIIALKAEYEAALEKCMTEGRQTWCETEGEKLARRIDALASDLRDFLSDKIGDALSPIAANAIVEQARHDLLESVETILSNTDHPVIAIHASSDLLDAVRKAHPQVLGIRYIVHDDIDATIIADGLRIETQLKAALSTLTETGH